MIDLHNNASFVNLFPPVAAVTGNTAQVSSIIDMATYAARELVFITGTLTDADATFAVTLEHGNDSGLSDTAVPAASDLLGTPSGASFTFANDNTTKKIGYIGTKRYIRATVTPSNNTGNLFLAGVAVLMGAMKAPVS